MKNGWTEFLLTLTCGAMLGICCNHVVNLVWIGEIGPAVILRKGDIGTFTNNTGKDIEIYIRGGKAREIANLDSVDPKSPASIHGKAQ